MEELTLERAIELAREAVAEKGADYVYTNPLADEDYVGPVCLYAHGDECGCIVGNIYRRHGASIDQVRKLDKLGAVSAIPNEVFPRTEQANKFLRMVQRLQDGGRPWGEAVERAAANWEAGYDSVKLTTGMNYAIVRLPDAGNIGYVLGVTMNAGDAEQVRCLLLDRHPSTVVELSTPVPVTVEVPVGD